MNRIALIDSDTIVYGASFRAEEGFDFGDGQLVQTANASVACTDAGDRIEEIIDILEADRAVVVLSDANGCFRQDFWSGYKASRRDQHRPLCYNAVREYLCKRYDAVIKPRLEGDDVLGIMATGDLPKYAGEKIIVSIDKDMLTIPGKHYNPHKEFAIREVDEDEAEHNFFMQVLGGDSTDGYPGCPGIGPVRAARILEGAGGNHWPAIVETYEKKGLTEQDALIQARCARILHASDYDFKQRKPILWTPTAS